ncbi:MAG: DNA-directed RNA polymerase subunit omega, partial [Clostridia bacterium]|nr:DNA-directed RNA polymerase subunit omega [Clostridia bacterium]
VNVAAKRARDIAQSYEESEESLPRKAVSIALDEIDSGKVEVLKEEAE